MMMSKDSDFEVVSEVEVKVVISPKVCPVVSFSPNFSEFRLFLTIYYQNRKYLKTAIL